MKIDQKIKSLLRSPAQLLHVLAVLPFLLQVGCGTNAFNEVDKKDAGERAVKAMENSKPQDAIDILEPVVTDDPANYRLVALLAGAYAQRSGVETFSLIKSMVSTDNSASSTGGTLGQLINVLPAASADNIKGLNKAITYLQTIPVAQRKSADNFLLTLFLTASVSLQAKSFDSDGDGKLTVEELKTMTVDDAKTLLNSLSSAADVAKAVGATDGSGGQSTAASAKIEAVFTDIQKENGATNDEKLKNYLAKKQGS